MPQPASRFFVLSAALVVTVLLATACSSDSASPTVSAPHDDDAGVVAVPTANSEAIDGSTFGSRGEGGAISSLDSDDDGLPDALEGDGDDDHDGIPNVLDPINDGDPSPITLVPISTNFDSPVGIDYHEPTNSVVLSVNYRSNGTPVNFERIELDGSHHAFSNVSGWEDEVKIATVRSGNAGGFKVGDLFVGNGVDGQIARVTDGGATVINPWVDLPGEHNGLMRGSLYVDRTGVFGGDLIVVTNVGEVWRITSAGVPTRIASVPNEHLEGLVVVPDKPARFGPLAGKILAGAEQHELVYAFSVDGSYVTYELGVGVEDIDLNTGRENFFGVDLGGGRLLGVAADEWASMLGDIIFTSEYPRAGTSGLYRVKWTGKEIVAQPIPLTPQSAPVGPQWEHATFASAGIVEVSAVPR